MHAAELATPFDIRSANPITTAVSVSPAAAAISLICSESGERVDSSSRLRYV